MRCRFVCPPHVATTATLLALLVPAATPALPAWTSVGADGGGIFTFAQAPSAPSRMYAQPSGLGFYRSDDRGDTWTPVSTGLPMDATYPAFAVSPVDEDLLLAAATANVLIRSTDGGVHWTWIPITGNWGVPVAMAFDPGDPALVLLATRGGITPGIHRSTDAGLTWEAAATAIAGLHCVAFQPGSPGVALAGSGSGGGAYRSTDGGVTWAGVDSGGLQYVESISFCPGQPTRAWAAGLWGLTPKVITSTDGGLTFAQTATAHDCVYGRCRLGGIAAHPSDPQRALVLWEDDGGPLPWTVPSGAVSGTSDGGATWAEFATYEGGTEASTIAYDVADVKRAYAAVSGQSAAGGPLGLRRSTDGGATWSGAMNGIHALPITGLGHDIAGTIWVRPADVSHVYYAASPSDPWGEVGSSGRAAQIFHVNPAATGVLHEVGSILEWDIFVPWHASSTDAGATWEESYIPSTSILEIPAAIASNGLFDACYLWTKGDETLIHLVSGGFAFATYDAPAVPAAGAVDPADPLRVWSIAEASPGTVHASTDGGATWIERAAGLPADDGVELLIDPADGTHLLAVYETAGVWETESSGLAWTPLPSPPGSVIVDAADWDPATSRVFLATRDDGVWITDLGFVTDGLPTRDLGPLDYLPGPDALMLGTQRAGAFALQLPTAAVDAPTVAAARSGLRVHPSPFTGSLTVELDLPAGGVVASVDVFDVAGRRVATLLPEETRAGTQAMTWNGRTAQGAAAAPGAYFVSARIGERRGTERVVLLR